MKTQTKTSASVLASIQCLRAIAALMVVWVHGREQFAWIGNLFPSGLGNKGVDIFFVISGFIMVVATDKQVISPWIFWKKRLVRIVPLYWMVSLALLAVAVLVPQAMKTTVVHGPHVVASLFFWPMESPALPGQMMPFLIPGWTLNYEMAFYALFSLALLLPKVSRTYALVVVLLSVVALGGLTGATGVAGFYSNNIVLTFGLGLLVGECYCRGIGTMSSVVAWAVVLSGAAFLVLTDGVNLYYRVLGAGLPAAWIVWGACNLRYPEQQWPSWLIKLGDASYALYLIHVLVLGAVRVLMKPLMQEQSAPWVGWVFMVSAMLVSCIAAWLAHFWVEKPVTRWVSNRLIS